MAATYRSGRRHKIRSSERFQRDPDDGVKLWFVELICGQFSLCRGRRELLQRPSRESRPDIFPVRRIHRERIAGPAQAVAPVVWRITRRHRQPVDNLRFACPVVILRTVLKKGQLGEREAAAGNRQSR